METDPVVQQATANLFADMGVPHPATPLPSLCFDDATAEKDSVVATSERIGPVSTVNSVEVAGKPGRWTIIVKGGASLKPSRDATGGGSDGCCVAAIEVSIDGGEQSLATRWHPAVVETSEGSGFYRWQYVREATGACTISRPLITMHA